MPPLGRYLLHASLLRHHVRVWQRDEPWLAGLREQVDGHVVESRDDPARAVDELRRDEIGLRVAGDRVERMRASVETTKANMAALEPEPRPADRGIADWFLATLDDSLLGLIRGGALATEVRELSTRPEAPREHSGRRLRMGFALDVVDYSGRSTPEEELVQRRMIELVEGVLDDLDVRLSDADHQGTGNGLMVFLPERVDVQRALPRLLRGAAERLERDNTVHHDRCSWATGRRTSDLGRALIEARFAATAIQSVVTRHP